MPYDFENYKVSYALWNIGDYFWRLYREDLRVFAENRNRTDIVRRIHQEWDAPPERTASGTDLRIRWALEIYNHGDWEESLRTPVPPYKKGNTTQVTVDVRRKYPAEYRCDNGIYVRSLSELCIANWLYANRIPFDYERQVTFAATGEVGHCDFYLPESDAYIEFWGLSNDKSYEGYKLWKENNYKKNAIPLVSLYPSDLKNLRDRLCAELARIGKSL